jgi:branched-chain amino acid transport system ATP-binding protein
MSPRLEASGVSVRYGGVHALSDVDLQVADGELVGLIGPNGAGKTTFVDAITGFVQSAGQVLLGGVDISTAPPETRARRGLARTWQSSELFEDLSVRDNLAVASGQRSIWHGCREILTGRRDADPSVQRTIELLGLEPLADAWPGDLTEGQRKLAGVARALVSGPQLLCLDEPAAGLDTGESRRLGEQLRRIADGGTATLLIDHDMGLVLSICDRVVVLEFGRVIANGTPAQVRSHKQVVAAYLGESAADAPPSTKASSSLERDVVSEGSG